MDNLQAKIEIQKRRSKCWANPEQELLLNACLFQGERSLTAWEKWRSTVDFEAIDSGSYRLLPLLYRNLSAQGVTDPLLIRCKGVYRKTWYDTQLRLRTLTELCQQFQQANIPTLAFKGAALALQYYQDCGLRPMADVDLLIPVKDLARAEVLLNHLGWVNKIGITHLARVDRAVHSYAFHNEQGQNCDLHWHLLHNNLQDESDNHFWRFSSPLKHDRLFTNLLNPTDQLLCVCVHGLGWSETASIRWIADAFVILKVAGSQIDWQRLINYACQSQLVIALREALQYLHDRFSAPIPEWVLQTLAAVIPLPIEQSIFLAKLKPPTLASQEQMLIANQIIPFVTATALRQYGYQLDHLFPSRSDERQKIRLGILGERIDIDQEIPSVAELVPKFDQEKFEVFVYLTDFTPKPCYLELECQKCINRLSILPIAPVFYVPDDQALGSSVETIRSDRLDILLITSPLTGTSIARLLALHRLAPVQFAWVSAPLLVTIDAVDYVLYANPEVFKVVTPENQIKYVRTGLDVVQAHCEQFFKKWEMGIHPPKWIGLPETTTPETTDAKQSIYLQRIRDNFSEIRQNRHRVL